MATMKAAVCEAYGPPEVVKLCERPRPVPRPNEVLIRAHATTVNSGDARMRAARVPRGMRTLFRLALGWSGPRQGIFGVDVAGDVVAVGSKVSRFHVGDRVLGSRDFALGCHAEYSCIAEDGPLAAIPDEVSYEDAAALVFGGATCLTFFAAGALKAGERILINGASGAVGVMAIQLAKQAGAEVTAVCSAANIDLVKRLGADHAIDYAQQDFARGDLTYDVIMDNHGNAPYARVRHLLAPGGRFLLVIGDLSQMIGAAFTRAVVMGNDSKLALNATRLEHLLELARRGALTPVIERTYRFDEIVEAYRHVDGGHKKGSVVLTFD
jgi:NADPH:quinone reductase-like Zn-dependent oxidoreductase